MSKATVFEKIAASVPQNATAAKVVARGTHYEEKTDFGCIRNSDLPLPVRTIPGQTWANPNFRDLTGTRVGRLTVLGLAADARKVWVVRCQCGNYEHRSSKATGNPNNAGDMCHRCRRFEYLKNQYSRLGGKAVEAFVPPSEEGGS